MGLDEVAHRTNNHVTESDIGLICNGLKEVFFVRGNADCHYPVAFLWHGRRVEVVQKIAKYLLGVGRSTTYPVWEDGVP